MRAFRHLILLVATLFMLSSCEDDRAYYLVGTIWECDGLVLEFLSTTEVAVYEAYGDYYSTGEYEIEYDGYIHFYYLEYITPYDEDYDPNDSYYTTYIFGHASTEGNLMNVTGHYYYSYTTHETYTRIF